MRWEHELALRHLHFSRRNTETPEEFSGSFPAAVGSGKLPQAQVQVRV